MILFLILGIQGTDHFLNGQYYTYKPGQSARIAYPDVEWWWNHQYETPSRCWGKLETDDKGNIRLKYPIHRGRKKKILTLDFENSTLDELVWKDGSKRTLSWTRYENEIKKRRKLEKQEQQELEEAYEMVWKNTWEIEEAEKEKIIAEEKWKADWRGSWERQKNIPEKINQKEVVSLCVKSKEIPEEIVHNHEIVGLEDDIHNAVREFLQGCD